jgi:hypothetical protein
MGLENSLSYCGTQTLTQDTMLVLDCTLSNPLKFWGRPPTRAKAGLAIGEICDHSSLKWWLNKLLLHAAHELLPPTTPVYRNPAQSVAMLAGTDGLPPWLDIDRFHLSRHSFSLSHCNGSRFGHRYSMALCNSEWLALPTMSPWWCPTFYPSGVQ